MPDWEKDLNEFLDGTEPEKDKNFPSVEWIGFIKVKNARKERLELTSNLVFVDGQIFGCAGFQYVKEQWRMPINFFQGEYDVKSGKVSMVCMNYKWVPLYLEGYNENKKIYGQWKFMLDFGEVSGGFMFWPRGMADPTRKKTG
ncbi:MAG: hypothetical protein ACKO0V_13420 [bacterium]